MSRSRSNLQQLEHRQSGQEYRDYLLNNRNLNRPAPHLLHHVPSRRSMNSRWSMRNPWLFGQEIFTGGSNHAIGSLPLAALPHAPVHYFLIENYNPRTRFRNTSPGISGTYYNPYDQTSAQEESRLSQDDQNKAINKLRKQLYNPHISNIIRRLGTKGTSSDTTSINLKDDIGKRCAVCLEDFESRQFVTSTPCDHLFHEDCIMPWVKSQGKCPVCRFVLY